MKLKYAGIAILGLTLAALAVEQGVNQTTDKRQGGQMDNKPEGKQMNYRELTPEEKYVIVDKGTEMPYTGQYLNNHKNGTYVCKRCGASLYRSSDKFDSECGWPSFDDEIPGAIKRIPDADGMRTEIECANCGAHLGHVFTGEGLTDKNIRHCVNSISLLFVPAAKQDPNEPNDPNKAVAKSESNDPNASRMPATRAYFAGGCFWGVDYWLRTLPGVISVTAGYMGGTTRHPTYEQVCTGTTGHAETVEVVFDPAKTKYEDLAKLFFEIHDPTQLNRQGPDVGYQYRSAIFYVDENQKQIAERLINQLRKKGLDVVTSVEKAKEFWPAENYHQNYYGKNGKQPYCHIPVKRF